MEFDALGSRMSLDGTWIKTARLADEWHQDIRDPLAMVEALSACPHGPDVFSFWQRLPEVEPRYHHYHEPESIAALPVKTYEYWLRHQINSKTRNMVTKAAKKGVVVRPSEFDDKFLDGMWRVFNETPIRQGRRFPHFGKDIRTLRKEFSRFLCREEIFGAYLEDEMIGFIFLVKADRYAMLGQVISMIRLRDHAPNNALIAKAVEVCAERDLPSLVYGNWPRPGGFRDFKRSNGFECVKLPRYYVPLTRKGGLSVKLRLHRRWQDRLPDALFERLKDYQSRLNHWRYGGQVGSS